MALPAFAAECRAAALGARPCRPISPVHRLVIELLTDFEIVLNGRGTINLLHRKFESSFVWYRISLLCFADCLFMYIFLVNKLQRFLFVYLLVFFLYFCKVVPKC